MNTDTRTNQYAHGITLGDTVRYNGPTYPKMHGPHVTQGMTGTVVRVPDGSVRDWQQRPVVAIQVQDTGRPVYVPAEMVTVIR